MVQRHPLCIKGQPKKNVPFSDNHLRDRDSGNGKAWTRILAACFDASPILGARQVQPYPGKESMTDRILKAARELGIESAVHVTEDHQLDPLVNVIVGTHVVQCRIGFRWLMANDTRYVRTILLDLHRMASNS